MKILALGDCNTTGKGRLERERCVPAQLARLLEGDGLSVDLVNLGYTMSTSREGVERMRREGADVGADLVLVNFGLVDAWVTTIPAIYVPYYPDNLRRKYARKLLKTLKRRLRSPFLRRLVPMGEVVPLDEFRANVEAMMEHARRVKPAALVVLWGSAPTRDSEERNENLKRYDECLRALAQRHGARFIDTRALLADADSLERLYLDNVHLSARGAAIVARAMYEACRDHFKHTGSLLPQAAS